MGKKISLSSLFAKYMGTRSYWNMAYQLSKSWNKDDNMRKLSLDFMNICEAYEKEVKEYIKTFEVKES